MKGTLTGKTAWVTGSSRGIGRVIAGHLASMGAHIVIHGTSSHSTRAFGEAESLQAVADEIELEQGVAVLPVTGDLADDAVVQDAVKRIRERFGRIDVLVNCAGGDIGAEGTLSSTGGKPIGNDPIHMSVADIRSVVDRNLMTCILVCRAVAPEMIERREGVIVNIGSIAGLAGNTHGAVYATAKAAVHEYTRCLADMLRPYDVRVNAVAPGLIITPRIEATRPIDHARRVTGGALDRYGWPIEVARTVAFLVADTSAYVTGQVIRVDGGRQLWPA